MKHNYRITFNILKLFLLSAFAFMSVECDSVLPEEFQETYFSTELADALACDQLSLAVFDSLGQPIDSVYYVVNSRPLWDSLDAEAGLVDSSAIANKTHNQVILANFDSLVARLSEKPLIRNSVMAVEVDTNEAIAYALLNVEPGQSRDIYIYTSLRYTERNIDDYITVQLVKRDTTIETYNDALDPETVPACAQAVQTSGGEQLVPTIRTRYRVHLENDVYLVRFIMSEAAAVGTFKLYIFSI